MELNLDDLRGTIIGEFLKCAMMSDVGNITSYKQSSLDLEVTLDGNKLDLQRVFSTFEDQLGRLDVPSEKRKELVEMVESSLKAVNNFVKGVNDENSLFVEDLRTSFSRANATIQKWSVDKGAASMISDLNSLLSALK